MKDSGDEDVGEVLPVPRPRAAAGPSYDRLSGFYDLLTAAGERPYREKGLELLAVRSGERVLEVGFGTGRSLPALAESAGQAGAVFGLDLSMGMAQQARKHAREIDVACRPRLCLADAVHPPFRERCFDAVWMSFVLELFDTPDIPRVLREVGRMLRPDGRIVVVSLSREGEGGLARRLYEWGHMRMPALLDCRPIYAARSIKAAGFHIRRSKKMLYWGIPVEIVLAENQPVQSPSFV